MADVLLDVAGEAVLGSRRMDVDLQWLLGLVSGYTIGALIHVLLVVSLLVGLLSGRRVE